LQKGFEIWGMFRGSRGIAAIPEGTSPDKKWLNLV
jgi:hypothetical protein